MADARITPVLMPKWGLSMEQGLLTEWLVEEGAEITVGDEIAVVETDKIAGEVEAADAGTLRRRVGAADESYPVGALLAVMAPADVSEAEIDEFVANYVVVADASDDDGEAAALYEFTDTPAGRLRYAVRGDAGPAVVLVHGFGGDLDNWLFNIDALAQHATVYALDLPGHGQSTKTIDDPSLSGLAASLKAFMDAVDVASAHLVGHSMGAAVSARFACDYPEQVDSLTMIGAAGLGADINADYIGGFVNASSRRELKPVLQHLFADSGLVTRSMVDDLLKYKRIDGVNDALQQLSASLFAGGVQQSVLTSQIADLNVNTLIIWGEQDQIIPASHAGNLESANVEVLGDAGHMVQMEQAARVNELILGHIRA